MDALPISIGQQNHPPFFVEIGFEARPLHAGVVLLHQGEHDAALGWFDFLDGNKFGG